MKKQQIKHMVLTVLFSSKWLLLTFYFGLIVSMILYSIKFIEQVIELCLHFRGMNETEIMLAILGLIDITMIANLIKMIIIGSYQTFVGAEGIPDKSIEKVTSGQLKIKMGMSLIGVSSIHLLQTFINSGEFTNRDMIIKGSIFVLFVLSTIGLAFVDYLHAKGEALEDNKETNHT